MRYENDLRVIFDQSPNLSLGLDVRPEIPILKGIQYCCIALIIVYLKFAFVFSLT